MRAGGGKSKGSAFERAVGKQLSLWLTYNERPDIFARNVLSGGTFTRAVKAGGKSSHMPGDLMAAHPLAFEFLAHMLVECKHMASLSLENYLFDANGSSPMSRIVALAQSQAEKANIDFMIVAKQNRRDPIVLVQAPIGRALLAAIPSGRGGYRILPTHHFLHKGHICIMRLDDITMRASPRKFLDGIT